MKILVLDATNKSLVAAMSAAANSVNPEFVVSYADTDSSTFTEASTDGALTGTTNATLVSAPSSGVKRLIKSVTIYNKDTAAAIVFLKLLNDTTERIIEKITLAPGAVWHSDSAGASSVSANGNDTQIQFNDGGAFAGSSNLTFDKNTNTLTTTNAVVSGTLTVSGTTTTINSTTLQVNDKNIELGLVGSPTNTTADGGGITLKGTTDKTFNWLNASSAWTSSEHIATAAGKAHIFAGATSGTITLTPTAIAGTTTITLPATTGTLITTGDTGTISTAMLADGSITTSKVSSSIATTGKAIAMAMVFG